MNPSNNRSQSPSLIEIMETIQNEQDKAINEFVSQFNTKPINNTKSKNVKKSISSNDKKSETKPTNTTEKKRQKEKFVKKENKEMKETKNEKEVKEMKDKKVEKIEKNEKEMKMEKVEKEMKEIKEMKQNDEKETKKPKQTKAKTTKKEKEEKKQSKEKVNDKDNEKEKDKKENEKDKKDKKEMKVTKEKKEKEKEIKETNEKKRTTRTKQTNKTNSRSKNTKTKKQTVTYVQLHKLTKQCIFLASFYFDSIEDYINVEKCSKKFRGNMERFSINPISVTHQTIKFFPNIQSLCFYDEIHEEQQQLEELKNEELSKNLDQLNISEKHIDTDMIYNNNYSSRIYSKNINYNHFFNCEKYTKIIQFITPQHWSFVENKMFTNDVSFTSIQVPQSLKYFNDDPLPMNMCDSVTITIPSYVTKLEDKTFSDFTSLEHITIPENVQIIGKKCFENCISLKEVVMNGTIEIGEECFNQCTSLSNVLLPNTISIIPKGCFANCSSLKDISIPFSVKELGEESFHECTSLSNVELPNNITSINKYCFSHCSSLTSFFVPVKITSFDKTSFHSKQWGSNALFIKRIVLPSTVTELEDECFMKMTSLESVVLSSPIVSIGKRCFRKCYNLNQFTIPTTVTSLGEECFYGCHKLEHLIIPTSVKEVNINSFKKSAFMTVEINKETTKYNEQILLKEFTKIEENGSIVKYKHNEMELEKDLFDQPQEHKNEMGLYENEITKLEEWTGMKLGYQIFDSKVDDYNKSTSTFDDKVKNKKQILILVETKENKDMFGCYIDATIDTIHKYIEDEKAFIFSLTSDDIDRYSIIPENADKAIRIDNKRSGVLFTIGNNEAIVYKGKLPGDIKQPSWNAVYDYRDVQNAIIGTVGDGCFTAKRIQVIQMVSE